MAGEPAPGNRRRGYRSPVRAQRARSTRAAILGAAHDAFVEHGYAATSLRAVADAAGVSVPTIEQAFGTKRNLLKAVVDVTKAGDDEPVPLLERPPALTALAATSADEFLALATAEMGIVSARVSAIFEVVAHAAAGDRRIAELADELDAQRRDVARWIVEAIRRRGSLREWLDVDAAVDTTWILLDPVVHRRLTRDLGRSADAYATWLADGLARLLLR